MFSKETKNKLLYTFLALIFSIITIYFTTILEGSSNLTLYLLSYIYSEFISIITFCIIIIFSILILGILYDIHMLSKHDQINKKSIYSLPRKTQIKIAAIIYILIMTVINIFPVSNKYDMVIIRNETPSSIEYKWNILLDIINQDTSTEIISYNDIKTKRLKINYKVKSNHTSTHYYIEYVVDNHTTMCSLESGRVHNNINVLKKLEKDIEIEYYKHSGIIKSINGYEKNDKDIPAIFLTSGKSPSTITICRTKQNR